MIEATIPGSDAGSALERASIGVAAAAALSSTAASLASIEEHAQWPLFARLPLKLQVCVPMPGFRVRDLLALKQGLHLSTVWPSSEDVPLSTGGAQLAWGEFEVVEQRMAIRLTRLA